MTPPARSANRATDAATNTPRRWADGPGTLLTFPDWSMRIPGVAPAERRHQHPHRQPQAEGEHRGSMCGVSLSGRPVTTVAASSVRLSNRALKQTWARISRSRMRARC